MIKSQKSKTDLPSSTSTSGTDISEEQEVSKSDSPKKQLRKKTIKDAEANTDKSSQNKKKNRKKSITICLVNCRYEVIKKVAQKFGLKEVTECDNWNLYWTDMSISIERCKEMKRFQRINHFPGQYFND